MKKLPFMNQAIENEIKSMAEVALYLWKNGWAERNAGNISINITDMIQENFLVQDRFPFVKMGTAFSNLSLKYFLVSATGTRMRDLARDPYSNICLIRISAGADEYQIMSRKDDNHHLLPTSELPTHMAIHNKFHRRKTKYKAVVHAHADELIALSQIKEMQSEKAMNRVIWGMQAESIIVLPHGIAYVPFELSGSNELADATLKALNNHKIVMWEKHGCLSIGENLFEAFDKTDIAAKSARIYLSCKAAGFTPEGLSDEIIDEIRAGILDKGK